MKIFFDTNLYVAEALLGRAAERILETTQKASWRIYVSTYVAQELERVLKDELECSPRFAALSRRRVLRRGTLIEPPASRHTVPQDPADSPVLKAALAAGVDYLVTNDRHLLDLSPYESLRIVSIRKYYELLTDHGLMR